MEMQLLYSLRSVFKKLFQLAGLILLAWLSANAKVLDPGEFSKTLSILATEGLGVSDLQAELDRLQFTELPIDGQTIISTLSASVEAKFQERYEVVRKLKATVEASYARSKPFTEQRECCGVKVWSTNLEYDSRYRQEVDLSEICVKTSGSAAANPRHLDSTAINKIKQIASDYPFIKWQYFGSEEGMLSNFPAFNDSVDCDAYDPRYRPFYVETATPEPKDVVLVIDTSGSMGANSRMRIAKEAANTVLNTMNPRDRIGLVSFESQASTPGEGISDERRCFSQRLADATPINLEYLESYVDLLFPSGGTNYGAALSRAFDLLNSSSTERDDSRMKVIIFLTDGQPNDNKASIMRLIKNRNSEQNNSVIILTYGMQVNAPILEHIAKQDGSSYGVPQSPDVTSETVRQQNSVVVAHDKTVNFLVSFFNNCTVYGNVNITLNNPNPTSPGKFTNVFDTKNLRTAMATYYDFFSRNTAGDQPIVSIPYVDAFGLGLITSITLPCYSDQQFIGVVGTDISMEDLLSDITYFRRGQASYAFMVDSSGRTMMHPLLPTPSDVSDNSIFLDIRALEPEPGFAAVFDSIKIGGSGQTAFVSKRFLPRGGTIGEGVTIEETNSTYYWRPVHGTNLTVGLVVAQGDQEEKVAAQSIPGDFQFVYHRLDLMDPPQPCAHFSRYAANGTTVVKFGPEAFIDPFNYLDRDETKSRVNSFVAYMTSSKAPNPGFKEGIRDTVVVTRKVEDIWLRDRTKFTQYLVWRYFGTASGVFRLTPGTSLAKSYDPSKRPWYHTALSNTGLVALSTPYVDAFGAGVVITAAHTVHRGEGNQQHSSNDDVIGVMGADFPLSYFEKLLTDTYPKCKENAHSCFIIDGAGFLIMHDDFLVPHITAETLEYIHITEKEKDIAEDLLEKGFMVKKECRNFEEIKKESFYEMKLPSNGIDTLNSGGLCKKYQLSPVVRSNAFLGIVLRESSCFPKSCTCLKDKQCSRVQDLICQCPCASELSFYYCESKFPASNLSICPVPATVISSNQVKDPSIKNLGKCSDPQCSKKRDSESCDGVVGCYWCVTDRNDAPLSNQYCADINECYGGKEGTRAPGAGDTDIEYEDDDRGDEENGGLPSVAIVFIVLGSVVAAVMVMFLIHKCNHRERRRRNRSREAEIATAVSVQYPPQSLPPLYGTEPSISMYAYRGTDLPIYNQAMENPAFSGAMTVHPTAPPYNPYDGGPKLGFN